MARTATPARPVIDPTSDLGSGLALPLAKALAHLMIVRQSIHYEWPLTIEQATAEVQEAANHIAGITSPADHYSTALLDQINAWTNALREEAANLLISSNADPDSALSDGAKTAIESLVRMTWETLTAIDREITGIPNIGADPGRQP